MDEITNKASCLSLLSNAVLVWNTVRIAEIVGRLRASGEEILDSDLPRVSPLCRAHIIRTGTYSFDSEMPRGATLRTVRHRKISLACCRALMVSVQCADLRRSRTFAVY